MLKTFNNYFWICCSAPRSSGS